MGTLILLACIAVLLFGFVLAFGAPYLPTRKRQIEAALDLLGLKSGQTLLELGCGDGRVLAAAGARGITCIGYELNPVLAVLSRAMTFKYRKSVRIIWGNYWLKPFPDVDGIFVFLLDKYMEKLDKKIIQDIKSPVRLASFAFQIPGRKAIDQKHGIFLYQY